MLVTEFGGCLHDWDALPCPKHGACTDCDKHWIIKGDPASVASAHELHTSSEQALVDAGTAHDDDVYGANRWLVAHQRSLKRLTAILAIHADAAIPDGTLVQLKTDGTYEALPTGAKEI